MFVLKHIFKEKCVYKWRLKMTICDKYSSSEVHSEPKQTSKMERFARIVNGWKLLAIFIKSCILDIWLGSEFVLTLQRYYVLFMTLHCLCHFIREYFFVINPSVAKPICFERTWLLYLGYFLLLSSFLFFQDFLSILNVPWWCCDFRSLLPDLLRKVSLMNLFGKIPNLILS